VEPGEFFRKFAMGDGVWELEEGYERSLEDSRGELVAEEQEN